ncbi:unnamed protein product [Anisakis simplex]|uniref:Secreted protein n=1 Tax=Anisakis simplex TaxID=6269 RepID=A0A0M3JM59_ANISI|nr:unnamed protein product [Anisakis simplex]
MLLSCAICFLLISCNTAANIREKIPEETAQRVHQPKAQCAFSVHKEGPQGEVVSGNIPQFITSSQHSC